MSQENVERTHRTIDALNRRDLEAYLMLMDEDVEAVSRIAAVEGGLHGHDGIRTWWDNWFGSFPDYTIEVVRWVAERAADLRGFRIAGEPPQLRHFTARFEPL